MEDPKKYLRNDAPRINLANFQNNLVSSATNKRDQALENLNLNRSGLNNPSFSRSFLDKNGNTKAVLDLAPAYSKRDELAFNSASRTVERYTSHPAFSRLGFSTLRDNEAYYNNNTSWTGDFARASKYFFPVMGEVFLDNFGGGIRMFGNDGTLDPSNIDPNKGDLMTHSAKMAMSTRGGLGQSAVNIGYNMNYTLGIIGAIVAEDLLLAAAAPETLGGSLTVAAARTVGQTGKAIKSTFNTLKSIDKLKDALSAKKIYQQVNKSGNALVNSFVPNSYNYAKSAIAGAEGLTEGAKIANGVMELATTAKGVGALYRDLRIMGLSNDESMVEAAGVRSSVKERLTNQYIAANGFMPSAETMSEIEKQAEKAGNKDYWANLPFIYLTNNLTFNNLATPYKKGSRVLKARSGLNKDVFVNVDGTKVIAQEVGKGKALLNIFKDKDMFKYSLGSLGSYFAANISEGVQEIYQESASKAIEDYFSETYLNPEMAGMKLAYNKIGDGLASQMSQQGMEAFLGGFLGGGIIAGGGKVGSAGADLINAGYRKVNKSAQEKYEQALEKDKKANDDLINLINAEGSNVIEALAPELVGLKQQTDAQKGISVALQLDNRAAFETIKDESLFNYISALAEKGIVDNFLEALENYKTLSKEELLQAIPAESAEQALKFIDSVADRTKSIVATQAYVDKYYGNVYMDALMDPNIEGEERKKMQVAAAAFEMSKKALVHSYHSQKRTTERLTDIMNAAVEDPAVAGMMAADITPLFNVKGGDPGIAITLETEINRYKLDITALQKQLDNLKESEESAETKEEKERLRSERVKIEKQFSETSSLLSALSQYQKSLETFTKNREAVLKGGKKRILAANVDGYDDLKNALATVLNRQASKTNTSVDGIKATELLDRILDYLDVSDLNTVYAQAVTNLSNPSNFTQFYDNVKKNLENVFFKNVVDQFVKMQSTSVENRKKVLEELADIYVAMPNESIQDPLIADSDTSIFKFVKDGTLPEYYLGDPDNNDVDVQGRVIEGSETWNKIQDILMSYEMLEQDSKEDLGNKVNPKDPEPATEPKADVKKDVAPEKAPVQKTPEPAQVTYEESKIALKYAAVIPSVIGTLTKAWEDYNKTNPEVVPATLSEFMNGPGRQITEDTLKQADEILASVNDDADTQPVDTADDAPVQTDLFDQSVNQPNAAKSEAEFNKIVKVRLARTKKLTSLKKLLLDVADNALLTDAQKDRLTTMINNKIAEQEVSENTDTNGAPTPKVTDELQEDLNNSSDVYEDLDALRETARNNKDNPFDNDEVC